MRGTDGIAIIGVSCRFPSAPQLDALWDLLRSGQDAVCDTFDERRLGIAQARDANWVDRIKALRGGLLPDVDAFDAEAFDISAREACLIDPQQRLVLEVAWEALDDAGQTMRNIDLAKVGAYVGIYGRDYQSHLNQRFPEIDVRLANGGSAFALAGRLSYAFGFRGPSFTIDAACSSSLVAVHEACQALRAGECDLALAGGANLILDPFTYHCLSEYRSAFAR